MNTWTINLANLGVIPHIPDPYKIEEIEFIHRVIRKPTVRRAGSKKCEYCGNEFVPRQHNQRFCSGKCGDRHKTLYRHQNRPKPVCVICSKEFNSRGGSLYCSNQCRDVALKIRRGTAKCKKCNAEFTPSRETSMYCSRSCSDQRNKKC